MANQFTANYGLIKPDFNVSSWHDEVNDNFDAIDALIFAVIGLGNFVGSWTNSTNYTEDQRVFDPDDGTIWNCNVAHTSAATDSMSDDRTANPTYWGSISSIPVVRGAWSNDTTYASGDIVYDTGESLIGIANVTHVSSSSPNTMRDDILNFSVIADLSAVSVLVNSVNGFTGTVVLDADDISDTATAKKFATAAQLAAIATATADIAAHETRIDDAEADIVALQAAGGLSLEEGTWTPSIEFGGSNVGVTYGTRVGRYIKIGNLITVWCNIELTNNGTGVGSAVIMGLPYVASNVAGLYFVGAMDTDDINPSPLADATPTCRVAANSSVITLRYIDPDDSLSVNMTDASIPNTGKIRISLTYRTG